MVASRQSTMIGVALCSKVACSTAQLCMRAHRQNGFDKNANLECARFLCCLHLCVASDVSNCSRSPKQRWNRRPQQISEYEASTEATRVKLLITLAKAGQHDLAESLLKRYPLTGEFGPTGNSSLKGLILKARGNLTGAAKNYRAALADDPSLTLVRSELAQTLFPLAGRRQRQASPQSSHGRSARANTRPRASAPSLTPSMPAAPSLSVPMSRLLPAQT